MRDFELSGRSQVMSRNGMAATAHPIATLTAVNILQKGGNAVDAAIAASAVLSIIEVGSTGIGGDCFALLSVDGSDDIIAYNGSGRAPMGLSLDSLSKKGIKSISADSPHAVTIPGSVDAWSRLVEDYGSMSLGEIFAPAIQLAEQGYVVAERVAFDWEKAKLRLKKSKNAEKFLLKDGLPYQAGQIHYQKSYGNTLRKIAEHGPDVFYRGEIAEEMVEYLQSLGGFHRLEDFYQAHGNYETPIKLNYKGYEVHECGPNGQGIVALMILNILSGFKIDPNPLSADRLHKEIEAAKIAYAYRDRFVADPQFADVPVDWMLSASLAKQLRESIDIGSAKAFLDPPLMPNHPDTTYLTVVDKNRMTVSFINSLFYPYGSTLVTPKSGFLLQNRGLGFSLEKGHLNQLEPGKRPLHTIIPGMLTKDGRVEMAFGVMGGHYQAMGHAHLISKIIDYKMDIQSAIGLPRLFPKIGSLNVEAESTFRLETLAELESRGHRFFKPSGPLGGAQAIHINHEAGVLTAGSEHRKDGCALGY